MVHGELLMLNELQMTSKMTLSCNIIKLPRATNIKKVLKGYTTCQRFLSQKRGILFDIKIHFNTFLSKSQLSHEINVIILFYDNTFSLALRVQYRYIKGISSISTTYVQYYTVKTSLFIAVNYSVKSYHAKIYI